MPRKHTYISLKMYNDLEGLLLVIARGVSIPNFLESLLKDHFDTHRDEINELYADTTTLLTGGMLQQGGISYRIGVMYHIANQ